MMPAPFDSPDGPHDGRAPFTPTFDGVSLAGWHTAPRVYGTEYPGGPSILELFDRRVIARPAEPEKASGPLVHRRRRAGWRTGRSRQRLEVHHNDAMFGEARWGVGAQCRWRNIRIKEL